jgi:hypothetical protein
LAAGQEWPHADNGAGGRAQEPADTLAPAGSCFSSTRWARQLVGRRTSGRAGAKEIGAQDIASYRTFSSQEAAVHVFNDNWTTRVGTLLVLTAALVVVANAADAHPRPHGLGTSITLQSDDEYLQIQLLEVRDPAHVIGTFGAAGPGHKLIAVKLKLTNLSHIFYRDSPGNGTKLISTTGHAYPTVLPGLDPNLDGLAGMSQGQSQIGRLTFDVPIQTRPWRLRYTLDSGYSDQTGSWLLDSTSK